MVQPPPSPTNSKFSKILVRGGTPITLEKMFYCIFGQIRTCRKKVGKCENFGMTTTPPPSYENSQLFFPNESFPKNILQIFEKMSPHNLCFNWCMLCKYCMYKTYSIELFLYWFKQIPNTSIQWRLDFKQIMIGKQISNNELLF